MPRKPRVEVEGGLYHVIARGNNRQMIFHSDDDHKKFLSLLSVQKAKLGFFLYAYCLMSNHFHLLIERQSEPIGRIMQRVLTGYSQYYNRKYRKAGHVFQGRHKSILCQSDRYLGELVRYIHLNPVRAKMVRKAERYRWSSHRTYLGTEPGTLVDVDPVLRLFGARKKKARENFAGHVAAGARLGHNDEFYSTGEEGILGSEEFIDATIHRLGETNGKIGRRTETTVPEFNADVLVAIIERLLDIRRESFYGSGKSRHSTVAKELLILTGRQAGANVRTLSQLVGLDPSTTSRRLDTAIRRGRENEEFQKLADRAFREYGKG
jgi:Transposase and inactivated derivatives